MNYLLIKEKKEYNNVYILNGDKYLINNAIKQISNSLNVSEINITKFNEENFNSLDLVNACNQFSFFNEKRIIVLDGVQELKSADKNLITSYVANPNVDCYLLICDNAGVFSFLKNVEVIECNASDKYLNEFVKMEFEKNNKKINVANIQKLIEYCGGDLTRLTVEIEKLSHYAFDKNEIVDGDIEQMVAKNIELKVFELTNHLANKNVQSAHKMLYDMLKVGEPPAKILGLISNFFRRAFYAKINKGTDAELADELGCKEYAIKKAKESVKNFSAKKLKEIQDLILEADYNIKSGVMAQENALYYLIMKISL